MRRVLLLLIVVSALGCGRGERPDKVWGARGVRDGEFVRPRAAVIDHQDRLWVVDFTARVQAFDLDGAHLGVTFRTPDFRNGRPSGLGLTRDGELIVCDSHYHCLRIYDASGAEKRVIAGPFGYVSDAVQDDDGYFYISEFGEHDRITKLDTSGNVVASWGSSGTGPLQFQRLRALALGPDGNLYCADACNHRIQVLTRSGGFLREFGGEGDEPGRLRYPYDVCFGPDGELYVAEYGNQRVQKFTAAGESLAVWGSPGGRPGQLNAPWALAVDRKGRVHVVDTENHRVQRMRF
jgi:DNA-binding beta-propeller fold protein YncE